MGQPLKDPTSRAGSLLPPHCAGASHPALGNDERAGAAPAEFALRARPVEIRRGTAVADGVRQPDHGEGSGAPGADPREPGHTWTVGDHELALRRLAVDPPRRNCAESPALANRVAADRRGRGGLHRRRRRARDHASGRFHHHAVLDVARPRQFRERAGRLARWTGYSAGAILRRRFRRGLSARRTGCRSSGRRRLVALR